MTGITKREAPISWRPSKEARKRLAVFVSETGLSRNELLNQLVMQAESVKPPMEKLSEAVLPDGSVQTIYGQKSEPSQTGTVRVDKQGRVKSFRPDPDKIAAFQRKAGMGGSGKK